MSFGGPEFVLIIIGMAMFSGVLKSWGRAKNGMHDPVPHGHQRHGKRGRLEDRSEVEALKTENSRLRDRLEMHEDRLIVLEKIVTDSGFDVAHQIEMLRDPAPRLGASRDRAAS